MKANFIVEDFKAMKYIGCSTLAKNLYRNLSIEKEWNSTDDIFDVAHFHTFGPFAWYILLKRSCPSVLTAHSTPKANPGNVSLSEGFWRKVYRKIYNKFNYIIAVSETSKRELIDMGIRKDISVIYNGVDREKFSFSKEARNRIRKKHGLEEDDFLILNVGQKTPRKGFFDFVKTSRKVPDAEFIWVGGIPYSIFSSGHSEIKETVNKKYKNLTFPGFIERARDYYCAADLFLTTSNFETFGLTPLEAMSTGLPVIMKDLDVFEEIFSGGGILCEDLEEIVEMIKELKKNDSLRKKYRKKSLKHAEKFNIERIAEQHINLYKDIIQNVN
ncbi:MAG: glycosyltransferase family 4 protein [Candidatus Thermoplasmatota archaeon]